MNIGRLKTLCWIVAAALGAYLGWIVVDFITVGKGSLKHLSREEQEAVLADVKAPPPPKRQIVPYKKVTETFWDLNWTGKQKKKEPVKGPEKTEPEKQPTKPVSDLLTLVLIQYLSSDPEWSRISVHYKPSVDERLMLSNPDVVLREGDRLPGKYDFISVASIQPDYAEFAFETPEGEEPRENERVYPPEYTTGRGKDVGIAIVGEDGEVLMPQVVAGIAESPDRPRINYDQTYERRKNQFVVGNQDAQVFARDYTKILSSEVRIKRYKDPKTGRYTGVQIKGIQPGSIVTSHGLQVGDIVKSINDEPVSSTQQAISYVKTNADVTSHWVVVVERQGKDMTLTYDTPPEN